MDMIKNLEQTVKALEAEISELRKLDRKRGSGYKWSKEELAKVAGFYKGSPPKFSLSRYIDMLEQRDLSEAAEKLAKAKHTENPAPKQFLEPKITLQYAVMQIFHASCPNYTKYMGVEGFDTERFSKD